MVIYIPKPHLNVGEEKAKKQTDALKLQNRALIIFESTKCHILYKPFGYCNICRTDTEGGTYLLETWETWYPNHNPHPQSHRTCYDFHLCPGKTLPGTK